MKFCKTEGVIAYSGGTMTIRTGTSFDDNHPLVLERPELFNDSNPGAEHQAGPVGNIERATAAPGEIRTTPGRGPQQGVGRVAKSGSGQ